MSRLREKLFSLKIEIKEMLLSGCFSDVICLLNFVCDKEILKATDYDYYLNVCPYDESVSKTFQIDYINASFVDLNGDLYIACQDPKLKYVDRFLSFLNKADYQCIISLNTESHYPRKIKIKDVKIIEFKGEQFIRDELLEVNRKEIRRIVCLKWQDFSVMDVENFEFLIKYLDQFDKKLKIIHCRAGVGRTGTFIMYRVLREYEKITIDIFVDLLLNLRSQRPQMVTTAEQLEFLYKTFLNKLKVIVEE